MTLTEAQRRVLVDLSDGSWSNDSGGFLGKYSSTVLARLDYLGLIRSDVHYGRFDERNWTITEYGIDALKVDT